MFIKFDTFPLLRYCILLSSSIEDLNECLPNYINHIISLLSSYLSWVWLSNWIPDVTLWSTRGIIFLIPREQLYHISSIIISSWCFWWNPILVSSKTLDRVLSLISIIVHHFLRLLRCHLMLSEEMRRTLKSRIVWGYSI